MKLWLNVVWLTNTVWSAANVIILFLLISPSHKPPEDALLGELKPLPSCPELGRFGRDKFDAPVLRTVRAAQVVGREFLLPIAGDLGDKEFHGRVGVKDDGDTWKVFTLRDQDNVYGGDIFININKCNGAVVHLGA